ncbi:MAG TPA: iron ABC transporter permease [Actinomycetaceae bacterium]|nr:iron ABC transporter permease [Actinomycetaceae bacterium]
MASIPLLGDPAPARLPSPQPGGGGIAALLLAAIPLVFLAVFFIWPVTGLVGRGFITDGALDLTGFAEVLTRNRTWRVIGQTLSQALVGTAFALLLGIPGAYLLYRRRWRGRNLVRAIVTIPFVLPSVVVGVAFRALLADAGPLGFLHLDGTFWAIVLALVFFNYSVVVRTVGAMWARLDPRAGEAAAVLGAPPWRVLRDVILPALGPSIASAAAIVFLYCSTAYGVVLVLGGLSRGTVETEIYLQTVQFLDLRAAAVLSIVQLVMVTAALAVAGRARAASERALGLRAVSTAPLRLRGPGTVVDRVAVAATGVVVLGLLVTPMAYLVVRSLRQADGTWGLRNYANLSGRGEGNPLNTTVWDALQNSVQTALGATAIAVLLGVMVSIVLSRRPKTRLGLRGLEAFDAVFMLPLGVSAVTVGFGFLITLDRPPLDLRSSVVLVPIAQAVVALPMVVRMVLPVLRAIDPRQREAAAVLGASPARVFATVDGPYLVRSLGLAMGFAFTISLGEFGATSFLARPDTATLPVVIFRLIGRPGAENFGMAMAACVVLAALTAGVMALAEQMRMDTQGEW